MSVRVLWGLVVVVLSLLAWVGQTLALLAPDAASRWNLTEAERDVDPTFWADVRAEAFWDALTLWVMVAAGVLLIADAAAWPYLGLIGGGMYLYFGGRGIAARVGMGRRGLRIGSEESVRVGIVFLGIWMLMAVITIAAAIAALEC